MDNVTYRSSTGTSPAAVQEATKEFNSVAKKCPNSKIVFSGYSQGAALMHATVSKLSSDVKSKAVGGVLFGDTRNKQSGGYIANYPKDKVIIICAKDDGVCWGQLNVNAGHLSYIRDNSATKAADFLISKLGMGGSAAPAEASSGDAPSASSGGRAKGKGLGRSKGSGKGKMGGMGKMGGKGKMGGMGKMGGKGRGKGKGTPPPEPAAEAAPEPAAESAE
jgi:cutinase